MTDRCRMSRPSHLIPPRSILNSLGVLYRSFLTRGTVGSNSILSFTSLTAQFFSNVVIVMILARLTDTETLGEILYCIVFANLIVVLVSYGLDNLILREISQARYTLVGLALNLLIAKLILALILVILTHIFMRLVPIPLANPADLWFYVGAAVANSFASSISALRKGKNDFVTDMEISLFQNITFFGGVLAVVFVLGTTTRLVGQIRFATRLLSVVLALFLFVKKLEKVDRGSTLGELQPTIIKMLFVVGLPFALQAILGTAYFQTDTLVLGAVRNSTEVAYYQSAMQIVTGLMLVSTAVIQAYYPRIAHQFSVPGTAAMVSVKQMLRVLGGVGLCLMILTGLGAPLLLTLLYGPTMKPGIQVLQILSLVFLVRSIAGGLGITLMSTGYQRVLALAGLNLLFVPRNGYMAAAWVSLSTNLIILGIYGIWWKRVSGSLAGTGGVQP
jgi:O-antigen/teichoic acid export membrane protein